MIKACLFDIGNVLVSFDYLRTFGDLAGRTPWSYEQIVAKLSEMTDDLETGRLSSEDFVGRAVEFIGSGVHSAEFRSAFTRIFEPIQPVWEVMEEVRAVVPVYLFSNTNELHEQYLFQEYPVFARFHGGFYSWRVGSMKPEDKFYTNALNSLKLPPESVAYIDDLPANIETGRRLGLHCHQYDRSRHGELLAFLKEKGLTS